MHQQLWGHKVEEKLYVGVREQKRLNTIRLENPSWTLKRVRLEYPVFSKTLQTLLHKFHVYVCSYVGLYLYIRVYYVESALYIGLLLIFYVLDLSHLLLSLR
jgi:hypothetical protein